MALDDASWHYGAGSFPKYLPPQAGATHIGMFVAWMAFHNMLSTEMRKDLSAQLDELRNRIIRPGEFVWRFMEGKLSKFDLSAQGQKFARKYYTGGSRNGYLSRYEKYSRQFWKSEDLIPDNWEIYERVAPILDALYLDWRQARR